MEEKLISVILPAYNAEAYLKEAIDSILAQTYTNFELLVLNDGSTDKTEEIILSYDDPRIRYIKNETNLKLIKTLNKGIDLAKGEYIARMDADDISLPMRFEEEFKFMEMHPSIDACSSKVFRLLPDKKIKKGNYYPCTTPSACVFCSMFRTPLSHPASFFRTKALKNIRYDESENALHIEAFVLWGDFAMKGYQMGVLKNRLLLYRDNENSICHTYPVVQINNHRKRAKYMIKQILGLDVPDEILNFLFPASNECIPNKEEICKTIYFLDDIYNRFVKANNYSNDEIKDIKKVRNILKRSFLYDLLKRTTIFQKPSILYYLIKTVN